MLHGWIEAPADRRQFLEELGVHIGKWCTKDGRFENCRVPEAVLSTIVSYNWDYHLVSVKR